MLHGQHIALYLYRVYLKRWEIQGSISVQVHFQILSHKHHSKIKVNNNKKMTDLQVKQLGWIGK